MEDQELLNQLGYLLEWCRVFKDYNVFTQRSFPLDDGVIEQLQEWQLRNSRRNEDDDPPPIRYRYAGVDDGHDFVVPNGSIGVVGKNGYVYIYVDGQRKYLFPVEDATTENGWILIEGEIA